MSTIFKKISARRLDDISGTRRSKPQIRAQARALKAAIAREKLILDELVRDTQIRRSMLNGLGEAITPLAVWSDFDHASTMLTKTNPRELKKWTELTEYAKAHLGLYVGREFGCYAFTANLLPELEASWLTAGRQIPHLIQKRIKRELDAKGLNDLPYFYVIEGRTRSTKSRTQLHIHGYAVIENPISATMLKLALEAALRRNEHRRIQRQRGVQIERAYDVIEGRRGPGRWVSYITKNVDRYDARIKGRRVFFSQSLTQITRSFWYLLREDAVVG